MSKEIRMPYEEYVELKDHYEIQKEKADKVIDEANKFAEEVLEKFRGKHIAIEFSSHDGIHYGDVRSVFSRDVELMRRIQSYLKATNGEAFEMTEKFEGECRGLINARDLAETRSKNLNAIVNKFESDSLRSRLKKAFKGKL